MVYTIEENECTASIAFGHSPEDMREALKEFFDGQKEWRLEPGEVRLWSVSWRGNNGWGAKFFTGTADQLEKKIKQLKFDRIDIRDWETEKHEESVRSSGVQVFSLR